MHDRLTSTNGKSGVTHKKFSFGSNIWLNISVEKFVCHIADSNPGIVGGAIVVVALVLLAIIGAVVLVRKHRDKQRQKGESVKYHTFRSFCITFCVHACN
jgi:ABC-type amino acid transport system permease subunit